MARTDVHSPTNLVTEDYDYTYAYDAGGGGSLVGLLSTESGRAWWAEITANLARVHPSMSQCDHCGAHIRYVGILKHRPTGQYITVGETCLENRFERATADFHRLRKQAQLDRAEQRIVKAATRFIEAVNDPPAREFLADKTGENDQDGLPYFLADIRRKLWRYGDLSERQVAAVARVLAEQPARQAERDARAAERAAEILVPPPVGRVTIEGTVVKTEVRYTDYGSRSVMTVKVTTPDGGTYLVWGSKPSGVYGLDRGDRIRFTATVEASDREGFGFFRRPTRAEILTTEQEEQAA